MSESGREVTEACNSAEKAVPVARITSADEYGPILVWSTHWVDLIGRNLFTHPAPIASAEKTALMPYGFAPIHENGNYFTRNKSTADYVGGMIPVYAAAQPSRAEVLTDDEILQLVATVLGNPLLFEDLKQDFTVHTEADDWIKFARALKEKP